MTSLQSGARFDRRFWLLIAGLLAFFALLYLQTLYPGIGGRVNYGDSGKWHYLWMVDGTPHSPGYPLFLALTKLFGNYASFVEPELRVTLISPVSALIALFFVGANVYLWTRRLLPAAAAIFIVGTARSFWSQATEAEVYTLNAAFVCAVIFFFGLFHYSGSRRYLLLGCAIYALSFGNHLTMITLLPALFYITWVTDKGVFRDPRVLAPVALFAVLGAAQYLYLLFLSHYGASPVESFGSDNYWDLGWLDNAGHLEYIGRNADWPTFFSYITGGQFSGLMGQSSMTGALSDFAMQLITQDWGLITLLALFYGLVLYRERENDNGGYRFIPFLLLALAGQLLYVLSYEIPDKQVYFIPPLIILTLLGTLMASKVKGSQWCLGVILLATLVKGAENHRAMETELDKMGSALRETLMSLPEGGDLFFERAGPFFSYSAFTWLNFYRYCEDCDFRVNASNDIRNVDGKDQFWGLSITQATLDRLKADYAVDVIDAGEQIRSLVQTLGVNQRLVVVGNRFDLADIHVAYVPLLELAGSQQDFRGFAGAYIAIAKPGGYIEDADQFDLNLADLPDTFGIDPKKFSAEVQYMNGMSVKMKMRVNDHGERVDFCSAGMNIFLYDVVAEKLVNRYAICGSGESYPSGKMYRFTKRKPAP